MWLEVVLEPIPRSLIIGPAIVGIIKGCIRLYLALMPAIVVGCSGVDICIILKRKYYAAPA
jgi:hypothetical protein